MEVLTMFRSRNRRRGARRTPVTNRADVSLRRRIRRGNTSSKTTTPVRTGRNTSIARKVLDRARRTPPARSARNTSLAKIIRRARRTPPSVARRTRRKISPTQLRNIQNQYRGFSKRSRAASKGRRPLKKAIRNTRSLLSNFARRRRR